VIRKLA